MIGKKTLLLSLSTALLAIMGCGEPPKDNVVQDESVGVAENAMVLSSRLATPSLLFTDAPTIWSQYSPTVLHEPGWDRYRMYFGRNNPNASGYSADRIWLSENFGDGLNGSQWINTMMVLDINPLPNTGESRLIHDPTVVKINNTWHMYYTGTDDANGLCNRIFHADSADGVNWTRRGKVTGLREPDTTCLTTDWGIGHASAVIYGTTVYLYFFDAKTFKVHLATASTSTPHNFAMQNSGLPVTTEAAMNPDVYVSTITGSPVFVMTYNSPDYKKLYQVRGASTTYFNNTTTNSYLLHSATGTYSWEAQHVGMPGCLPKEGKCFYAGNSLVSDPVGDSSISVLRFPIEAEEAMSGADVKKSGTGWYTDNCTLPCIYSGGKVLVSNATNNSVELDVIGKYISLKYFRGPNRGIAYVSLNGSAPIPIDMYAPTYESSHTTATYTLPSASSQTRVKVWVSGQKNAASNNYFVVLDHFEVR